MKKVVLALAVIASVALVSCSSNEKKAADSDTVAVEAPVADTLATDSSAAADSVAVDSPKADSVVK